jgi:large subunit ribosomal protein L13
MSEPILNVPGYTKHYTSKNHERQWLLVDANNQTVGRVATQIADLLRGKHKPTFTRHDDVGDFVVVINAKGLKLRGNDKPTKKIYYHHSGHYGHLKRRTGGELLARRPEFVLYTAVYNMIPSGALCNRQMKKLKIYAGAEHPHKAQNPQVFPLKPAKNS